ncbi:FtsX-like permease family protein [Streptomyces sp. NPDC051183]|uniref:FtsX-like permease family protein n=1 Tax=unclassified Streptomyces TaxID=2593676 RepID=UPI003417707F
MSLTENGRAWWRDLAMGVRFAFGGGRESWIRTLFTGVGVGLGVALLLVTTALPSALTARTDRGDARLAVEMEADRPGPDTLLTASADQDYRGKSIEGVLIKAEGPEAPVPPGLSRIPAPGRLAVSPALDRLMKSDEGALLRERLGGEVTELIGDAGLLGPGELYFYAGNAELERPPGTEISIVHRSRAFGGDPEPDALDPVLALMVVLTFVALLMPVVVFVAAAVRFGGDRRDRRLAALRLVGADHRMVRRIAAGEALAGALAGLLLGAAFFLASRQLVGSFALSQRSVFPADLDPSWWLAALVALAVPAAAVAVTLFTLRGVLVEPLGVVRAAAPVRRRIWWRLLLPAGGLGLLAPLMGRGTVSGEFGQVQVSVGVVLLLVGITALLPWLLERTAGLLSGGPVSWQLAVRRLQVASGTASRLVNGIAVAVAGAIALQMLFAGTESGYTVETGADPARAALSVAVDPSSGTGSLEAVTGELARTRGVARAAALSSLSAAAEVPSPDRTVHLTVGTCEALREVARLAACAEGDAFVLADDPRADWGSPGATARPGEKLFAGGVMGYAFDSGVVEWTVPANARTVPARPDPDGRVRSGLLVTPSAAPQGVEALRQVFVQLDPAVPDAIELARTAAFRADPASMVGTLSPTRLDPQYGAIRSGLFIGATLVLVLIGLSLLVAQLEQLRERRKLLSALVAFGTPRRTLSLSVLWQTALPVTVAMVLASATGLALGSVLLRMSEMPVSVDWGAVLALVGAGAGVVVLVTLLSMPPLLRMMRPDGLRTE